MPKNRKTSTFLVHVWMCLVVIGGTVSSKMAMAFVFRSRELSFLQNNVCHHRQTKKIVGFWSLKGV